MCLITAWANGLPRLSHSGFGFAVDLLAKDLGICLFQADSAGVNLPTTAVVESALRTLIDHGHGKDDVAALMRIYRDAAGTS